MPEPRIVSLIASATEMVVSLGFAKQLVGVSHECDYPPEIVGLPVCSEPKIDVSGTSREIDDRVKALAGEALSIYRLKTDVLRELRPTHIITQTQCDVCAVSLRDVEEAMHDLIGLAPTIVALAPMRLADVWEDYRRIGAALDRLAGAEHIVRYLKSRLDEVASLVPPAVRRPKVACIEWIDPLMVAGNWVPELVAIAGGHDVLGKVGQHSPWLEWDVLAAADPDVIVVMPCGFDIPRTVREIQALDQNRVWQGLRAVRDGQVYLADGNQYFNRPGPRLIESARILAEVLYRDEIAPLFYHCGWICWSPEQNGGWFPPAPLG